jgi:hypothetical protein
MSDGIGEILNYRYITGTNHAEQFNWKHLGTPQEDSPLVSQFQTK